MANKQNTMSVGLTLLISLALFVVSACVGMASTYYFTRPINSAVLTSGEISFHFMELGNENTGDSTYIKAGDIDILIDAGSTTNSISTIENYINNYITDGKIEYVIVTHAHEDHYAGFATNSTTNSIFDDYEIGIIIDFAQIEDGKSTKAQYLNYQRELNEAVARGAVHYTAQDCVLGNNGAKAVFEITSSVTMKILDQKFYHEKAPSGENNHSVCTLFSHGDKHFLLTGDLEKEGEQSLVEKNPDLPHCALFKAGHHGSYTSSNDILLNKITPEICCVCCCAGNVEYLKNAPQNLSHSFPAQEFIDRIAKHTDKVYVTTLGHIIWDTSKNKYVNNGFESLNGNIVVSSTKSGVEVNCSNNNTILKNTDWFRENRTTPSQWAT